MTRIDDERDPQVQQLERMKNDFLVAQQRRRERAAASHGGNTDDTDDTGDGDVPHLAGHGRRWSDGHRRLANLTLCRT
jgi:hypothetical protein